MREKLSEQIPDSPDFPAYEKDEKTKEIFVKDEPEKEKPSSFKSKRRERRKTFPAENIPEKEDAGEKTVVEEKKDISEETREIPDTPKLVEEDVALAKADIPQETEKIAVPAAPAPLPEKMSAEKLYFERWNGECLVYRINWNFVRVGKALIAMKESSNGYGEIYHLVALSVPEGMLANMGMGYYRIDAFVDKKTLLPHYYYQYSKNKNKEDIQEIYFNWKEKNYRWKLRKFDAGKLYKTKSETLKLNGSSYDGISSFYMVRTLDFENKNMFTVPVVLNEIWDLIVKRKNKSRENIPDFGAKNIYVVEPQAKSNAGFFTQGKMDIWITADNKRLPVYLEGKVPLGTAKFYIAKEMQVSSGTQFNIDTISRILSQVR
ncbi:MAG TPA: DUF3108 domain-containing protein [bacterium]|nr:DUF3108 domain-containing protein [bacterium]